MNKKFTKLIAALALLLFIAPPLVGWGQTTYSLATSLSVNDQVIMVNPDFSKELTGISSTSTPYGIASDINNSTPAGTYILTVVAGNSDGSYAFKTPDNKYVSWSSGNSLTTSNSIANASSWTVQFNSDGDATVKNVSTSTRILQYNAGSPRFACYTGTQKAVRFYKKEASDTPTCTINPTSWDFGDVQAGSATQTKEFNVTTANLTEDLTVELVDGNTSYSVDASFIEQGETSTTITVTLDPTAVGLMVDTLRITGSGVSQIDVKLTANVLCNEPTNALAYPTPGDQILENGAVSYTLNPTANTGNGGPVIYTITTNPDNNGEIIINNDTTFHATGIGQYVVHAEQALYGTTCGGSADITINVFGPNQTITFDAGSGTCNTSSIDQYEGKTITLPTATPSAACVSKGWIFAGWAAASVSETTTAPTGLLHAGEDYLVTTSETLYAVYKNGSAFDNTAGGEFTIYAIVGANTYYAKGTGSKINSTTDESEATIYTFEKPTGYGDGEFAIKTGSSYITYSGSGTNLGTSTNAYKWTISQGTKGTWRATSGTSGRGLIFRAGTGANQFGGYATSNVTQSGTEYYDIEIGGSTPPTYNSNPSCLEQVATPTFTPAEGTYTGAQNVTINCTTEDASILYKTAEEGQWQTYSTAIPVSTTTTIWAKATKEGMDDSDEAEATYTIQYTLTDGIENVTDYYLFDYHDEIWDNITPDENGHALVSSEAEVRISGGLAEECYTLQGFYVVYGNNDTIDATYITEDGDYYYSFPMPASDATLKAKTNRLPQHTVAVGTLSNVTLVLTAGEASDTVNFGEELCEGINVTIAATPANGYVMESVSVLDENDQSVEVTYQGTNTDGEYIYSFEMPASDVTIAATAVVNPYVEVSLTSENMSNMTNAGTGYNTLKTITVDGYYWETNGYQTDNQKDMIQLNNSAYINLPSFNGKIETITFSVTDASSTSYSGGSVYKGTLKFNSNVASGGNTTSGTKTITLDVSSGFYSTGTITCASKAVRIWNIDVTYRPYQDMTGNTLETIGNDVTVSIPADANVTADNLTIPASSGIVINSGATLTISGNLANNGNANNIIVKDGGQLKFYDNGAKDAVQATVEKNIDAWTTDPVGGWYFIASPINVNNLNPSTVENMLPADVVSGDETTRNYDLYWLENTMWRNYRQNSFNLANGQGYLYARREAETLEFAGAIKPYTAEGNANQVPVSAGWNLIGNPYTFNVYVDQPYYTISQAQAGITAETVKTTADVAPCTGILVNVDADGYVTFSDEAPSKSNNGNLNLVVAQVVSNRGNAATLDNAIVSFNEGDELGKFYFGAQNANLYIPQGTEEYAIVSSEAQGTMPVNFRANENGEYILTVNPENVEMNYLHLIDNMTGADIDLLANPSYSFNATTSDYENRFKLVFASDASTGSASDETFAFYSNGNWIINNAGNATLQVVDLMGRILSSETVNGSVSKTINATPGVYMLRLINGENVKVQKVVIE